MMKYFYLLFMLSLFACEYRVPKESGLNDLVVGVQQFVMYENGEFVLELGLGGVDGNYKIKGDTVYLNYKNKMDDFWPNKILKTEKYFVTIPKNDHTDTIKIRRSYAQQHL